MRDRNEKESEALLRWLNDSDRGVVTEKEIGDYLDFARANSISNKRIPTKKTKLVSKIIPYVMVAMLGVGICAGIDKLDDMSKNKSEVTQDAGEDKGLIDSAKEAIARASLKREGYSDEEIDLIIEIEESGRFDAITTKIGAMVNKPIVDGNVIRRDERDIASACRKHFQNFNESHYEYDHTDMVKSLKAIEDPQLRQYATIQALYEIEKYNSNDLNRPLPSANGETNAELIIYGVYGENGIPGLDLNKIRITALKTVEPSEALLEVELANRSEKAKGGLSQ